MKTSLTEDVFMISEYIVWKKGTGDGGGGGAVIMVHSRVKIMKVENAEGKAEIVNESLKRKKSDNKTGDNSELPLN